LARCLTVLYKAWNKPEQAENWCTKLLQTEVKIE
jgi:hypothetical protein